MFFNLTQLLRAAAGAATAALLFTVAVPAAQAGVVYDNLGSSSDFSDPVMSYGPLANSFTTGAGATNYLTGIKALLTSGSADVVGDIQVSLHANSGTAPGAELISLGSLSSAGITGNGFGVYDFAPITAYLLDANTTYWIEIEAADPNAVEWAWSSDLLATGVAGQSNYAALLGASTNQNAGGAYQMSVTVGALAVPEPGSVALLALGLGLVVLVSPRQRKRG